MPHNKFAACAHEKQGSGYPVPLYSFHDGFLAPKQGPRQLYLTVASSGCIKGPHLNFIRSGCLPRSKSNVRIVLKIDGKHQEYFSGEEHDYLSIECPTGVPAAPENMVDNDVFVLKMPAPAPTPQIQDEHAAGFCGFQAGKTRCERNQTSRQQCLESPRCT